MYSKSGSHIRWQERAIDHLTFTVSLIITLTTGAIAFGISLLTNKDFNPLLWASLWSRIFFGLTILTLLTSIGIGIGCVINRLTDFRITRRIASLRDKGALTRLLKSARLKCKKLGGRTWRLFYWQIGLFAFGVLLFMISIIVIYESKLFAK